MADDFQVQGGNGRLYPLDTAKKQKEEQRLADLFAAGSGPRPTKCTASMVTCR